MRDRSTFALVVITVAIGLAIVGDLLLRGTSWGLNLPLWTLLTGVCGYGLLRRSEVTPSRAAKWLILPVLVFSLFFFWRDSDALKVANGIALALAIAVLAQRVHRGSPVTASPLDYTIKLAVNWIQFTADFAELLTKDVDWRKDSPSTARLSGVTRGLLLALPLVLLFGGLFASADAAFSNSLANLFSFDVADFSVSILIVLLLTVLVGGLFRRLCWPSKPPVQAPPREAESRGRLGLTEFVVAFGVLDLLFAIFVGFQFRFLFGGQARVVHIAGMTYAQYARSGFFELTAVAALTIPFLLGAQALTPHDSIALRRWFFGLGTVLTACVFVILGSALMRMNLYVSTYGLSELRLFTTLFMGWIAVTLAWLGISFFLRKKSFSFGALPAGYAFVLFANLLNPDAMIARTNLQAAKSPDLAYIGRLSLDAEPAIADDLRRLPPDQQKKLWSDAKQNWNHELRNADWRGLNLSRLHFHGP